MQAFYPFETERADFRFLVEFLWGHVVDELLTDSSSSVLYAIRGGFKDLYDVRVTASDGTVVARRNPDYSYLQKSGQDWPATDPKLLKRLVTVR